MNEPDIMHHCGQFFYGRFDCPICGEWVPNPDPFSEQADQSAETHV